MRRAAGVRASTSIMDCAASGIGVVTVVPDHDSVVLQPLAAHLAGGEAAHGVAQALAARIPNTRATAMRRQQIHHRVPARQAGLEIHAQRAETRAVGA